MAKTQTVQVPDELRTQFRGAIEQRDRYILGVCQGHKRLPSDRERKLLKRTANIQSPQKGKGSMFKFFSPMWRALSPTQKNVWKTAAQKSRLSGWQLFVSDNAARARNSLEFDIPPSDLWQVRGGQIKIEAPASGVLLAQAHPLDYNVTRKVRGAAWKEEVVAIRESFGLPLTLEIRYKANLVPTGGSEPYIPPSGNAVNFSLSPFTPTDGTANFSFSGSVSSARYFAVVWSSYQGKDIFTEVRINFSSDTDWTLATAELDWVLGHIIGYTLYIHIVGYTGELLYDNIRATHSGQNWARDPRCDNVSRVFNKGFATVLPFWEQLNMPEGASFSSVFPPALP